MSAIGNAGWRCNVKRLTVFEFIFLLQVFFVNEVNYLGSAAGVEFI